MRILFICNYNCTRSKAFEKKFKERFPEHQVLSAGLITGNPIKVNPGILDRSDRIYVMDLDMATVITKEFGNGFGRKIRVVGVGNDSFLNANDLNKLINFWINKRLWEIN